MWNQKVPLPMMGGWPHAPVYRGFSHYPQPPLYPPSPSPQLWHVGMGEGFPWNGGYGIPAFVNDQMAAQGAVPPPSFFPPTHMHTPTPVEKSSVPVKPLWESPESPESPWLKE